MAHWLDAEGGSVRSQTFVAGPVAIAVESSDERFCDAVDELFVDLRADGAEPTVVLEVRDLEHCCEVGPLGGPT